MQGDKQARHADAVKLRKEGGKWLKQKREERGLSQSQLAAALGSDHYTFISQIEIGRSRVPHNRYAEWSRALGIEEFEFVRQMLHFYDPAIFQLMFQDELSLPFTKAAAASIRDVKIEAPANQ